MSLDEIKKYLEDRQGYGDFDDSDLIFRLVNEIQKLQTVLTKETEGLK